MQRRRLPCENPAPRAGGNDSYPRIESIIAIKQLHTIDLLNKEEIKFEHILKFGVVCISRRFMVNSSILNWFVSTKWGVLGEGVTCMATVRPPSGHVNPDNSS